MTDDHQPDRAPDPTYGAADDASPGRRDHGPTGARYRPLESGEPSPETGTAAGSGPAATGPGAVRVRQCRFPGCLQPAKAPNPRGGRPPAYCTNPDHNKARRFAVEHPDGTSIPAPPLPTRPAPQVPGGPLEPPGPEAGRPRSEVGSAGRELETARRRADRAEALADDRARALVEAEARAERREAQFVDRLMAASEEIATLRAQLRAAGLDTSTPDAGCPSVPHPRR